jgi:hypothetical protein
MVKPTCFIVGAVAIGAFFAASGFMRAPTVVPMVNNNPNPIKKIGPAKSELLKRGFGGVSLSRIGVGVISVTAR